jgi:hypothetical protein
MTTNLGDENGENLSKYQRDARRQQRNNVSTLAIARTKQSNTN